MPRNCKIPDSLTPEAVIIWRKIAKKYHITADWKPLLQVTLEAYDQLNLLKGKIETEGYLVNERPHPLLSAMEKCRLAFLKGWAQMHLDVVPPESEKE